MGRRYLLPRRERLASFGPDQGHYGLLSQVLPSCRLCHGVHSNMFASLLASLISKIQQGKLDLFSAAMILRSSFGSRPRLASPAFLTTAVAHQTKCQRLFATTRCEHIPNTDFAVPLCMRRLLSCRNLLRRSYTQF